MEVLCAAADADYEDAGGHGVEGSAVPDFYFDALVFAAVALVVRFLCAFGGFVREGFGEG